MKLTPVAAAFAMTLAIAGAARGNDYDCQKIIDTATERQRIDERQEVSEITRTCENGGLYCQPEPTDKTSCVIQLNRYIQQINRAIAIGGFSGFSSTFKAALDQYVEYANQFSCSEGAQAFERGRRRLEEASGQALPYPNPF